MLPLLRSQVQGELLALTYLNPDREFSLTDAARRIGASGKSVQHEVARLVGAGILRDRRLGPTRLFRSVTDSVLTRPLTDLIAFTYGPAPVLARSLDGVAGVEHAFLHGAWAARYHGGAGRLPADVDVLVVGSVDPDALDAVARRVEAPLGREVTIRQVERQAWERPGEDEAFLAAVRVRPLLELTLSPCDSKAPELAFRLGPGVPRA